MPFEDFEGQQRLYQKAVNCDPGSAVLGLLMSEEIGMPSPQHVCFWFKTAADLAEFLTGVFPYAYCGSEEDDISDELPQLSELVRRIAREGIKKDTKTDLLALQEIVRDGVNVRWVGRFGDLCAAAGEPEKELVGWFRDSADDRPIQSSERQAFAAFLRDVLMSL